VPPRHLPPLALAYHGVAQVPFERDRWRLFVSPGRVARHVVRLRSWGYELLTFGAWARCVTEGRGEGVATLTFDDGLADNLTTLAPLMQSFGVPFTTFVVTGWLGGRHPDAPWARLLEPGEVRALRDAGAEIGAHGDQHVDLTTLDGGGAGGAERDLRKSRERLEELLDEPVRSAAYPYGAYSPSAREAARRAGIEFACSTSGRGSLEDPLALPRQAMGTGSSVIGLRLKRRGRYEEVLRLPGAGRLRRASRRYHAARD
jgi:peptidoglycan/xylan/chitin deacetylase (PgdA/CDA1 family)